MDESEIRPFAPRCWLRLAPPDRIGYIKIPLLKSFYDAINLSLITFRPHRYLLWYHSK